MGSRILIGDAREALRDVPDGTVQTCVTSPPYFGLRDYGHDGQIGLESTVEEYVANLVAVFREVRRVLKDDGTLWVNLGDSYAANGVSGLNTGWAERAGEYRGGGHRAEPARARDKKNVPCGLKPKDLIGIPWRVAFALQADGWYLRSEIIWHKPNPMPESVTDRPTKAHEQVFLLSKSPRYYYDAAAIAEQSTTIENRTGVGKYHLDGSMKARGLALSQPGEHRNSRTVWTVSTRPYAGAHFAVFPPKLIEPCVKAGSREGDTVLDPFAGSGTTGEVATHHGRHALLVEINAEYVPLIEKRLAQRTIWDALEVAQ